MTRLPLVLALALGCGRGAPEPAPVEPPAPRPHVVLITLDTTRADHIGAWGHAPAATDTIDALAAAGVRFERAYSVLPLTIPSHASIFTGLYPPRHGIRSNGDRALAPEFTTLAERLSEAGWVTAASVAAFVTTPIWGFDQGFDVYFHEGIEAGHNFWHGSRPAEAVIDDALRFKASRTGPEPIFLWVHLYDPHMPWTAPEPYTAAHEGRPYDAELAYVDDQVGRLVEAFAGEPTLFVVVGDHGEGLGEHGELTHGLYTYDATQHVPFLISGPGVAPAVVSEPVSIVDVTPTILHQLGLPPLDGVDGQVVPGPARPVYMESWQLAERFGLAAHRALVSGPHKLIATPRPELYDLLADPGERENVAEAQPERVTELIAALDALAFAPPSADGAEVDAETALQLQQLGYVAPSFTGDLSGELPDPKDHARLLNGISRVYGMTERAQWAEAEVELRGLLEAYPEVAEIPGRLHRVLLQQDKREEARAVVAAAAERFPDNLGFKSARATQHLNEGRFREASTLYQEVVAAQPYHPSARARAVWALFRAGDADGEALELGLRYLEAHPEDAAVAGMVGLELISRNDSARARPYLELAATAPRPARSVCLHLGVMAQLDGDKDEARALLERELRLYPRNDAALRAMQVLLIDARDWTGLVAVADRLILLQPGSAYLHLVKAQALFNLEDFTAARAALDESKALRPGWSEALLLDANLLDKEGRREEALARFEEAKAARTAEEAAEAPAEPPATP